MATRRAGESFRGSAPAVLSPETVGASPSSCVDADARTGGSFVPHLGPLPLATGIAQAQPDPSTGDINPADSDAAVESPVQAAAGSYAPSPLAEEPVQRPVTHLQQGIRKPKTYTDGTVHWCNHLAPSTGEPSTL